MAEVIISIESVLKKLHLAGNENESFYSSKLQKNGVFIILPQKLQFAYPIKNDYKSEIYDYEKTEKFEASIGNDKGFLKVFYENKIYLFNFNQRTDILRVKNILSAKFPEKMRKVSFIKNIEDKKINNIQNNQINLNERLEKFRQSHKVSNKFLETANNLKDINKSNNSHGEMVQAQLKPPQKSKRDLSIPRNQNYYRANQAKTNIDINQKFEKYHQTNKVNEKLITLSETKFRPIEKSRRGYWKLKRLFSLENFTYIAIVILFIKSPLYDKFIIELKKSPQRINYLANFIQLQRSEQTQFRIAQLMLKHYKDFGKLPDNPNEYIRKNFETKLVKDIARDPWGNYYIFEIRDAKVWVISKGPDKTAGTDDDISESLEILQD